MAIYGWKERYDTVAIADALYASGNVRHIGTPRVSMGAAIALQSAAVEPRIEGLVAEDPFANLRELRHDSGGLSLSPLLGKTLLCPATVLAMHQISKAIGFRPEDVSPETYQFSRERVLKSVRANRRDHCCTAVGQR